MENLSLTAQPVLLLVIENRDKEYHRTDGLYLEIHLHLYCSFQYLLTCVSH